jgi:hypothetical protein
MPIRLVAPHWYAHIELLESEQLDPERIGRLLGRHYGVLQFDGPGRDHEEDLSGMTVIFDSSHDVRGWMLWCTCQWTGPFYERTERNSRHGEASPQIRDSARDAFRDHLASLPIVQLHRAHRVLSEAKANLDRCVAIAKSNGVTWDEVGAVLGMSRQSAHERWRNP